MGTATLFYAVDQQGHVLVTYRTSDDAWNAIWLHRTMQVHHGIKPGELDYSTVRVLDSKQLAEMRAR